jgi:hypothetical protein
MQRIRHFFNTLSTNWSQDPAARGAAKMTAGAVLVVEGLFGVIRRNTGRKKKGAGGLVGGVFGMLFALVFMAVGWFVRPDPIADERIARGEVLSVSQERGDDGPMYRPTYGYQVDGLDYQLESSMRSSSRPRIGSEVEISYSAADPNIAHRNDGMEAWFPWVFIAAGALVFFGSALSVLVSVVLTGLGVWLFLQGRADRQSVDASDGFFSDLFSLVRRARQGELDIERTAVGQRGASSGDRDLFSALSASAVDAAAAPHPGQRAEGLAPPASPPQGWYPDPEDASQMRWWDGRQWTDHRRPAS